MRVLRALQAAFGIAVLSGAPRAIADEGEPAPFTPPMLADQAEIAFDRPCGAYYEPDDVRAMGKAYRPPATPPGQVNQAPDYPAMARRLGREGSVVMLLLVNEEGRVVKGKIERSSSFQELDRAALEVTEQWRFTAPAQAGTPICSWFPFAVTFKLTEKELEELAELPVKKHAEELAAVFLQNYPIASEISRLGSYYAHSPAERTLLTEVAELAEQSDSHAKLRRRYAGLLSRNLSEDELRQILRFYRSDLGVKWQREIVRTGVEMTWIYRDYLGRYLCSNALVKRAFDEGRKKKGIESSELPADFQAELPRLVEEATPYCQCAARDYMETAETLGSAPAPGTDVAVERCKAPPQLQW